MRDRRAGWLVCMTTLAAYLADYDFDEAPLAGLPSCKAYVGSADSEDAKIAAWYLAAIQDCDRKISSYDFVDANGDSADPDPNAILAVFHWVKAMRNLFGRAAGVRRIKTGNREEEYAAGLAHGGIGGGSLGAAAVAMAEAYPFLEQWIDLECHCSGGVG